MINSKPAGLLSLLGLKSGLNAPQNINERLNLQIDALPFYIAAVLKLDESGTGVSANETDVLHYPVLGVVPDSSIRYIERASASTLYTAGAQISCSGWIITRASGSTYPVGTTQQGIMNNGGAGQEPIPALINFILQPGERLGVMTTTGALTVGQVNFGIRYADFIL